MLAALGLASPPASAQTFFPANATVNYALTNSFGVAVGYANAGDAQNKVNGTSPTVILVNGGSTTGGGDIYNGSAFVISGGTIASALYSHDASTVNITGGALGSYLYPEGSSSVSVSGGSIAGYLAAFGTSTVLITGGVFGQTGGVNFVDQTRGAFTFVGSGLSAVPTGPADPYRGTTYLLTGVLQSGQSISGDRITVTPGSVMFTLVNATPEPSQFAALAVAGLGLSALLLRARRRLPAGANRQTPA